MRVYTAPVRIKLLIALSLAAFLPSCSDELPAIQDVRLAAVFDFRSPDAKPDMYLSLFVSPSSDIKTLKSLRLTHPDSGFRWNVDKPVTFENGARSWAGSPRLAPYRKTAFAAGDYVVEYVDKAERSGDFAARLAYPAALSDACAAEAAGILPAGSELNFAVYDQEGNLLYYGKKNNAWAGFAQIRAEYPDAHSARECLVSPDGATVCLLPFLPGGADNDGAARSG